MSVRFLLDTNIVSEPLRPAPNARLLEKLRQHQNELAVAALTWHELWYGCERLPPSAKRTAIETYLDEVVAVTMRDDDMRDAGRIQPEPLHPLRGRCRTTRSGQGRAG